MAKRDYMRYFSIARMTSELEKHPQCLHQLQTGVESVKDPDSSNDTLTQIG